MKQKTEIAKFNKAINTVTELIVQNANINEINKSNDLLEVIMNKICMLTSATLKHKINDKIKKQDSNICNTVEFKLIQLQNFIESYIDMKIKQHKSSLVVQDHIKLHFMQKCHQKV